MNSSHRLNIGPLIIQAIPGIFFLVTIPAIDRKQPTRGRGGFSRRASAHHLNASHRMEYFLK